MDSCARGGADSSLNTHLAPSYRWQLLPRSRSEMPGLLLFGARGYVLLLSETPEFLAFACSRSFSVGTNLRTAMEHVILRINRHLDASLLSAAP